MKQQVLVIALSISSSLLAMDKSPILITDYQPTVATLGTTLQTWCGKNEAALRNGKDNTVQKAIEQEEAAFDPVVDRWVKTMCVHLCESGAYKKNPEFCTQLLLRKALNLQRLIDWGQQSSKS